MSDTRPELTFERIAVGETYRMRRKHPCGSFEFRVYRVGADIGIECLGCQRRRRSQRGGRLSQPEPELQPEPQPEPRLVAIRLRRAHAVADPVTDHGPAAGRRGVAGGLGSPVWIPRPAV